MRKWLLILALSCSVQADELFDGEWIDLTHEFSEETIYWPTAEPFKKETTFEGRAEAGFYYEAHSFSAAEHGGTHLDAPIHFAENRHTLEQVPVEQLIGPGALIRIAEKVKENRNYQLSVEDVLRWEKDNGEIAEDSILLVDTGSSQLWPDREKYLGTSERGPGALAKLKFPGIHPEAAKFLATERKVKAVGLDSPSIDFGGSKLFESHQILFEKNIPGMENVANLDQLPPKGFMVFALPMKIKGGSGGPLRVVAFIPSGRK